MDGYGHSHFINIVCKKIVMWEAPCLNDQVAALVGTYVTHSQKSQYTRILRIWMRIDSERGATGSFSQKKMREESLLEN